MRQILLAIVLISTVYACSPVRNAPFVTKKKDQFNAPESVKTDSIQKKKAGKFEDTTVVDLPAVRTELKEAAISMDSLFNMAASQFNNMKYKQACPKFKALGETLDAGDSLYFETKYYECECNLLDNNFAPAKNILLKILANPDAPRDAVEKSMVRLGQIYCVINKKDSAGIYFDRFKQEFPHSEYLPLADCSAVTK